MTDAAIDKLSDQDQDFQNEIITIAKQFSFNPREIKRFMNVLRFQRFIWETVRSLQDESGELNERFPTLDQLSRWIVLSLRWPNLIRWLYSDNLVSDSEGSHLTAYQSLKLLEELSESSENENFYDIAKGKLRLDPNKVRWLDDRNLWLFFKKEVELKDEKKRISYSVGQGVY